MIDPKAFLAELLTITAQQGASDLHLSPGYYPVIRVDRRLMPLTNKPILDRETLEALAGLLMGPERKERFAKDRELDFSFSFEDKARFRVNAYYTKGNIAAVLRFVPDNIRTLEELKLPPILNVFTKLSQGLVLVVGPNGHGKSTTLAAMIERINQERAEKIVTIEDPIEAIYKSEKSIIDQREVEQDTLSFYKALRGTFRQDNNVIVVGEMRDYETMSAAVTAAETGRLVFASLHTNSAPQTVERIIDSFPSEQQPQIRVQLANILSGVVSQRLVPRIQGGLAAAVEVMMGTVAVRSMIRENKIKQLEQVIETGQDVGMISLDRSLADLVRKQEVSIENAEFYASNPQNLHSMLRS
ncbi:MAG: PilT/PilU family type 4a pilus ATPase [Patescibacteria group bacterium]